MNVFLQCLKIVENILFLSAELVAQVLFPLWVGTVPNVWKQKFTCMVTAGSLIFTNLLKELNYLVYCIRSGSKRILTPAAGPLARLNLIELSSAPLLLLHVVWHSSVHPTIFGGVSVTKACYTHGWLHLLWKLLWDLRFWGAISQYPLLPMQRPAICCNFLMAHIFLPQWKGYWYIKTLLRYWPDIEATWSAQPLPLPRRLYMVE